MRSRRRSRGLTEAVLVDRDVGEESPHVTAGLGEGNVVDPHVGIDLSLFGEPAPDPMGAGVVRSRGEDEAVAGLPEQRADVLRAEIHVEGGREQLAVAAQGLSSSLHEHAPGAREDLHQPPGRPCRNARRA